MLRIRAALASLSLCAALSACAAQVQNKEGMLVAAGVTLVPANTPQRQASLASLPPHKFVHQERSNAVIFTYADPTICDCLYVGIELPVTATARRAAADQIAFHQGIHSDIGPLCCWSLTNDARYPAIAVTPLNPL